MVLNVTEEQKKLIESQGYMVVEFKLWFKDIHERLNKVLQRAIDDIMKSVFLFLQDMKLRAYVSLKEHADRILQELKPYIEYLKPECDFYYETRKKYPFVRSIGKKYQPNFSYKVIYHRCRDRC